MLARKNGGDTSGPCPWLVLSCSAEAAPLALRLGPPRLQPSPHPVLLHRYLASDMEEDNQAPKQDIFYFLYGKSYAQRPMFHKLRFQFIRSMGWKIWVSREECEEVGVEHVGCRGLGWTGRERNGVDGGRGIWGVGNLQAEHGEYRVSLGCGAARSGSFFPPDPGLQPGAVGVGTRSHQPHLKPQNHEARGHRPEEGMLLFSEVWCNRESH